MASVNEESTLPVVDKLQQTIPHLSESVVIESNKQTINLIANRLNPPKKLSKSKKIQLILLIITTLTLIFFIFRVRQSNKTQYNNKTDQTIIKTQGTMLFNMTTSKYYSWIQQKIDHFDENSGTFLQRIFIQNQNANGMKNFPIFLYVGQFQPLDKVQKSQEILRIAEEKKGILIGIETRYFGLSLPFEQSSYSTDNLKYLTIEQIIEDIAVIISTIRSKNYFNIKKSNPWIINGQQYSGTIVAWFISKYSKLVKGAIASSPYYPNTLIPKVSENLYFNKISIGGRNCRLAMVKMLKDQEQLLNKNDGKQISKVGRGVKLTKQQIFMIFTERISSLPRSLLILNCNKNLQIHNVSLIFKQFVYTSMQMPFDPIIYSEVQMAKQQSWGHYEALRTARALSYIQCNEIGGFKVSTVRSQEVVHKNLTEEYYRGRCGRIFGREVWPKELSVGLKEMNGRLNSTDNLVIVHGYYDIYKPYFLIHKDTKIVKCPDCQKVWDYEISYLKNEQKQQQLNRHKKLIDKWLKQ